MEPQDPPAQGHIHQSLFDSIPQSGLKCDIIFLVIKNRIKEEAEYVRKLRAVFQFNITKNDKHQATWTCDTKTDVEGDVYRSAPKHSKKADCILTVDDDDWVRIMVGKLNPQRAFMTSKLKVRGNIMLLQKLYAIWYELRRKGRTPELDLVQEIMVEDVLLPGLKSEAMAIEIVQRIVKMPHLCQDIEGSIQVNVLKNSTLITQYLISMHPGKKPSFKRLFNAITDRSPVDSSYVTSKGADLRLTVEDDDLVLIIYGHDKWESAIQSGRLKIEGNILIAEQARAIFELSPIMSKL